jgi:hypothetical protein
MVTKTSGLLEKSCSAALKIEEQIAATESKERMKNQYSLVVHIAQQRELSLFVARLRPHVLGTMAASRDARVLQATGLQLLVI